MLLQCYGFCQKAGTKFDFAILNEYPHQTFIASLLSRDISECTVHIAECQ